MTLKENDNQRNTINDDTLVKDNLDDGDNQILHDGDDGHIYSRSQAFDSSIKGQIIRVIAASKLFFINQFDRALEMCKQESEQHLYLTLSYGTMSWLRAWMTFEKPEIEFAIEALKRSVDLSSARKRHYGWMDYLRRVDYDEYTEEEIHAELAYADSVFMLALITFVQDQSFLSLIKGACRFRYGYQSYKICQNIIQKRTKWESEMTRREFESGVHAGTGIYNLALSMSPPRVLRILEFMGFSGDRNIGVKELTAAAELEGTGRSPFATILLLINFSYIETMIGFGNKDIAKIEDLLDRQARYCPESVFLPLFTGKLHQLKGNCTSAIKSFNEAIKIQNEWGQLHNACNWEIMWAYAIQCNWSKAAEYADKMRKESLWSPCTFTYQYAVYLYMLKQETKDESLTIKIDEAIKEVPGLKRRFAGKSTPREKFAVRMAEKYTKNGGQMFAPAFEIFYIWNVFSIINSANLIEPISMRLDEHLKQFDKKVDKKLIDEYCLLLLLKGVCLRHLGKPGESEAILLKIFDHQQEISTNHYILPCASLELGCSYISLSKHEEARDWMKKAITGYTKYPAELIVHVRAHFALKSMKIE